MFASTLTLWLLLFQLQADSLDKYRSEAAKWDEDVAALVASNAEKVAGPNDLLFLGSSSIRLWDTINEDLVGWSSVRRGYGGAKLSDMAVQVDKLLAGHHPKAILFFVSNDIAGNDDGKDISPEEVVQLATYVVKRAREMNPKTPIFYIAITPTPKRWHVWDKITQVNAGIGKITETVEDFHFLPTKDLYIDTKTGQPDPKYFRDDRLHLNHDGYKLWAGRISEELKKHLEKKQ